MPLSLILLWSSALAGGPTDCDAVAIQALTCSSVISDTVSTTAPSHLDGVYTCGDPIEPLTQRGPDGIYSFECQADGDVTMNISGLDCDVDIYILDSTCDPDPGCVEGSTSPGVVDDDITFPCVAGDTYYVVIEGYGTQLNGGPPGSGACGNEADFSYTLSFDVSQGTGCPEDCVNGTDDDLDGDVDCDDSDCAGEPTCNEECNGLDDDGDGLIDEGLQTPWYPDADGDGFGDANNVIQDCLQPQDTVTNGSDCDDFNASRNPDGVESCDGIDNDCDVTVDEGTECYDDDGDGFTELGGDCNDFQVAFSPVATEACNGNDEDCDGTVDEGTECYDDDGDGFTEADRDCNDADSAIHPDATEVEGDGIDNDCDGGVDTGVADPDQDGYDATSGGDCEPFEATAFPGAPELPDGLDNDCDGTVDEGTVNVDDDGDGASELDGDCDDGDAAVGSGAAEVPNGRDDDCDGRVDEGSPNTDDDGDGLSEEGGDCDDGDDTVHPGAEEQVNNVDDDCDDIVDEGADDADRDGVTEADGDCDDANGWVSPDAIEVCDGLDNDCDDRIDEDTPCEVVDENSGGGNCGCSTSSPASLLVFLPLVLAATRRREGQA
ncbi:MAG: pre-peptidase C-terminal domain-containing protein [Proteobacteria bacterium]|nr:pre-peptidase C-terminal domain-containing protein [Pseudomonadota bacterium]